mgnify:CR=1 FL=1
MGPAALPRGIRKTRLIPDAAGGVKTQGEIADLKRVEGHAERMAPRILWRPAF